MALRPGQRVLFNGRMGTIKANRPAGMVDVQFDDRKTGERRSARDLRPVRSNPRVRRNPDSMSGGEAAYYARMRGESLTPEEATTRESAELPQKEWLVYAKGLYTDRIKRIKGREQALKRNAQAQKKIHKVKEEFIADYGLRKFEKVDKTMADVDFTPRSPQAIYQGKIHDAERSAVEIKGTITALKKALGELSTGKYPKTSFSKAKAIALQKALLSVPVTVPKGEPPQRRKQRRAKQIAAARAARRQAPKPIRVLPLPEQVDQQEAAFKIVPDRPRSAPDRLSECGNPIDGKAYVLAIKSEKRTYPVWVKYSDLKLLLDENIDPHVLATMATYRQGRKKLSGDLSLEARRINPEEATTKISPWNQQWAGTLPDGVKAVALTQQRPANVRQRKRWITRSDGSMGRQQAGVSQNLHPRSRLPAPGISTGSKLEENDAVLLQLPDGTVRGFVVQRSMDPFRQRLQQDFSPFPPYTTKGDNPFYSWVPEEAGELQRVLDSTDPELGDAPCLTKSDKTQIKVANDAIRRVTGTFRNALSWHKLLGGDSALSADRARQRVEWAQPKMRDLYKLGKSIETNAPGYGLLHDAFRDGVESVVKAVQYSAYLEKTAFLSNDFQGLYQIFIDVSTEKTKGTLKLAQPVGKLLQTCVDSPNLLQGLMTYFEKVQGEKLYVEITVREGRKAVPKRYHWTQLKLPKQLELLEDTLQSFTRMISSESLTDCAKVLVDLCMKNPSQKVPAQSATSFFWYYALLLNRPGLVGPIGREDIAGSPTFFPKVFEAQVRQLIIALSGGSTLSKAARKWKVYKTYNPLVFHVTKEYFRDRTGWGSWHQHPKLLQEAEMIGYYGSLLRVVQSAEIAFAQNEGRRPENWQDVSQGLIWLLEPQLTEYGMSYNPMWKLISPDDWTQENLAQALDAFITDPKGYVTTVKNSALRGFTKIGTIANKQREVPAWTGSWPGTKEEITIEAFTHGGRPVEPLGGTTLPQGSVAYKMSQKQQMRETVLSHLNKLISTLS